MRFFIFAAALALTACAARPDTSPLEEDGRDIAEAQCAACHAVGSYGDSPNPVAPHFRVLLSRYRPEVLREELIAGIKIAHPMPEFQFNPQGAEALIAYLQSIQQAPAEPAN
jgi:cytochrome c